MRFVVLAIVITWSGAARADSGDSPVLEPIRSVFRRAPDMAIGVNLPTMWFSEQKSFGASIFTRLGGHHALRLNAVASQYYDLFGDLWDEKEGYVTDYGVGWVYFPGKRMWRGPSIEIGAFLRQRDTTVLDEDRTVLDRTQTTTKSVRVMGAWNIVAEDLFFIAIGAGTSFGYERGTEDRMPVARRATWIPEAYLRLGFKLGR